jgi:hypothetical protein
VADDRLQRARKRVRALREFYVHAAIYVVVICGLAAINWITSPGYWWVVWPMLGWGIAVAAHAVSVFFEGSSLGAEWEERKTRELMQQMGPVERTNPEPQQAAPTGSTGAQEGALR